MTTKCDKCSKEINYQYKAKKEVGEVLLNKNREEVGKYFEQFDLSLCQKCINEIEREENK
jgi:hypothetical protein